MLTAMRAGLAAAVGAVATSAVACGMEGPDDRFDRAPPDLRVVGSRPQNFALDVGTEISIDLCFDAEVDPRSLDDFDVLISSGTAIFDTQLELQLFPYRPPGRRDGVITAGPAWCEGSVLSARAPGRLRAGATFRLRMTPTARGWDGGELRTDGTGWVEEAEGELRYTVEFRTDPDDDPDAPLPVDPEISLATLFEPGEVFDPERGLCSCHTDLDDVASRRLDLRSASRAYDDLVLSDRIFGTGSPMVSPERPANSYLIQKLVHTDDGEALWRVQGGPMPPEGPLDIQDRARVAQWIAAGAAP